jgi:hypothetical protein
MLQFTDQNGTQWDVFEVSTTTLSVGRAPILPEAFRAGWLVFDCGTERRRLAPVPGEWSAFSDVALQSLLEAAVPVAPRARERTAERARELGA